MRRLLAALALLSCLGHAGLVRAAPQDLDHLRASVDALDSADPELAKQRLEQLSPAASSLPEARFQRGMVLFHLGEYAEAASEIEHAIASAPRSSRMAEWRQVLSWVTAARDLTREFDEARSADGRYVVRHARGVDEVLVSYALDALERADAAVQKLLGIHLPSPIRLEVYPSARALASVSSLSLDNIETSGTVALCKWNRLMIASPRSLLYGYPWLDTINHELIHLALTRQSQNRAPVWFHEGLAKLFERTWRGDAPAAYLAPSTLALLTDAAKSKKLIAFDRMHPSIAMLPSQEDAALAFAQVVTFLERFRDERGDAGLTAAIDAIRRGKDAREALSGVAGESFVKLEKDWQHGLEQKPRKKGAAKGPELKLRFVDDPKGADESLDVPVERARKHLRIGDLLWGRGHKPGAAREYEKARSFAPSDPILASRVARAQLSGGKAQAALSALDSALGGHPSHAPLHALRGTALLQMGRSDEAEDALREAIRLNPFDPTPHCELARRSQNGSEQTRERRACVLLGGPPHR
jgi:tetratricopeptide (TPR) repeat protein